MIKVLRERLMIKILLSLFFIGHSLLNGAEEAHEPIIVELATETQRIPIYITHFICDDSLTQSDCKKLEKILQFDFNHNGMTYVLNFNPTREKLADPAHFEQPLQQYAWKEMEAFYLIKVRIQDKKLSVRLFAANSQKAKSIDGLPLNGEPTYDRKQIHQLSDSIYKALFDADGIASTRFIYTVKSQKGSAFNSEVWEADYDGENPRQLTYESGYSITPTYVPPKPGFSSGTFMYVSYKTGQPKIYYQPLNPGATPHRLTYLKGNQLMPALSRQRDKVAFICDITGNPDLFILPFSPDEGPVGKPYQIFSAHLSAQATPTFSPDGSKLAFVSNKDGSPRIYLIDVPPPGTSLKDIKATLITKRNKESSAPAWSPDGTKIAYCSVIKGVRQVWIYDLIKREERQLTQGDGNKENPTWAPNSLHLIFNSSDAGSCQLYLINLNQPDAVQLTSGPGEKRFPSWDSK